MQHDRTNTLSALIEAVTSIRFVSQVLQGACMRLHQEWFIEHCPVHRTLFFCAVSAVFVDIFYLDLRLHHQGWVTPG